MKLFKKNPNRIDLCFEDKLLYTVTTILMVLLIIVVSYPIIYVLSCSFSSGEAVSSGKVVLFPVEPSLTGYKLVFRYRQIWVGYGNTIFYTVVGTMLNVVITTMVAYPLSRKNFQGRNIYMTFFLITMFFTGGIIPNYILRVKLHLVNTRFALLLTGIISTYNMIVMRTFFQNSIPYELFEAARIDGITDIQYLFKVVIPLSKAIFAVITLYYAVGHWNAYFNAMLYLRERDLFPLQLILRDILNSGQMDLSQISDSQLLKDLQAAYDLMKYSLIVVSCVPILIAYPFVQKYFEKGVLIGSVKG